MNWATPEMGEKNSASELWFRTKKKYWTIPPTNLLQYIETNINECKARNMDLKAGNGSLILVF